MNLIGKTANHSTDGAGTVTAFYDSNLTIWISFNNRTPRPYKVPEDFDSGLISTNDPEFLEFITLCKTRPSFRFSAKTIGDRQSPGKDIQKVYRDCCTILDDLNISYGKVIGLKIAEESIYKTYAFGKCTRTKDGFIITMAKELMADSAYDADLYDVMLHELLHTCEGSWKHNRKWFEYAKQIRSRYGFEMLSRDGTLMIWRYAYYTRWGDPITKKA